MNFTSFLRPVLVIGMVTCLLAGCSTSQRVLAPVEDRNLGRNNAPVTTPTPATEAAKSLPGSENAGKPGYYTVQRGDTLTRIGLDNGQSRRDLVRWNSLVNPDLIEVGQVLRVTPPGAAVDTPGVVVRPLPQVANNTATSTSPSAAQAKTDASPAPQSGPGKDDGPGFIWPANGSLIAGFDESKNKGLDISGQAGDPVIAAADGQVVYAGAGLRGYGNLIILKHDNVYLTAYAHNQALLVKEDQKVRKGQKIAEMGKSDADRVKLHFEVRRQGKPVDPAQLLPAR